MNQRVCNQINASGATGGAWTACLPIQGTQIHPQLDL